MKVYCELCGTVQPASFRPEMDTETRVPYEDLCCDVCDYVVATVEERETTPGPTETKEK